jgi:uncharacterized protein
MKIFFNSANQFRSIWWTAVFFLVLAFLTVPMIVFSQAYKWEITITHQAIVVITATWICQLIRKKPMSELTGRFNLNWFKNLLIGLLAGMILMLVPALFLNFCGYVTWQPGGIDGVVSATGMCVGVAVAEEFLFRGFIFQRLIASIGKWGAQLLMAAYFLLIHMNNPGMTGSIRLLASLNIFMASIMFGLAFTKTKSLAMPLALHFMANWMQGTFFGFGVSGNEQASLLKTVFNKAPQWMTGGSFGLEASIPGLICVIAITFLLHRWEPQNQRPIRSL